MGAQSSDETITCFTEVWSVLNDSIDSISSIFHDIGKGIAAATSAIWQGIAAMVIATWKGVFSIASAIGNGIVVAASAIWNGIVWTANKILLPVAMTGVNIIGYLLDKFLYGSPGLRPYLHDGLIGSEIPEAWRLALRNNTGWDIYENMGPILDNTFGILGLGVGALNTLNHLVTSIYRNFVNYSHVLGEAGVFGEQGLTEDNRGSVVKIVFGLFAAPVLFVPLLITNAVDAVCAFTKNFFQSFGYNIARTFNLLGEDGVMGPRHTIEDKRELPAQIFYGIVSAPFVAVISGVTNAVDGVCAFTKNFFQSFGYNIARTFNLLGEDGVMGPRHTIEDKRELPAQIFYGIISAPFVAVVSGVTNAVDGVCAFTKNFFQSFGYNIARTFNLLGEDGVMGPRHTIEDKRELPAQIFYGIISAPFVAVVSGVTNAVDGVCAFTKNFFQSFGYNIARTFNLLGEDGVMGPRHTIEDKRELPAQIFYGIISAPFVAVVSGVTNAVDGVCAFTKNFFQSFGYNIARTFNLLGEDGVMGPRHTIEDKRELPAQIFYGIISAPFVAVVSGVTNAVDVACSFTKNFFQSFGYNIARTFNLLGEDGVMGPRHTIEDKRELPAQIFYGIISAPFVAVVSGVTNAVDVACSFTKNFFQSFGYNIARTFNLLGEDGVMGPRHTIEDKRELPAQIFYGIISAPFVAVVSGVTNAVDVACSFTKNFFQSFGYNIARTFNLLGEDGVMGPRHTIEDKRELPAQIFYGIISAPFVAVVSSVTNAVDGVGAFTKNFFQSFGYNIARTFNLLGEDGVMGPRHTIEDKRELPAQIFYGIISAPFVAVVSGVTNAVDVACSFTKNFFQSFGYNIARTFNLLGEDGVMGPRHTIEDKRELPAQIFYGIISAPFVAVVSGVTNAVDGVCAFTKNFFQSFGYNIARTFNLLGEDGVMGPRHTIEDKRELPAQIFYGIISAPFVAVVSGVTNAVDGVCAFTKNFFQSFGYNIARTFNLLGEDGVMGPRHTIEDKRELPAQIFYGIISAPFVAVVSGVTNAVDGVCAFTKNFFQSFGYNIARTFNLLGEDGIMGPRHTIEDKRELPAQIFYGIISAPFVAIVSAITNTVDGVCAFGKNLCQSFVRNITPIFNLLGEHGVMGPRQDYQDDRGKPTKAVYGALTAPFVGIAAAVTNSIDGVCAYFKNYEKTIKKPAILGAGLVGGTLLAVPIFFARKVLKGAYNCTVRPISDAVNDQPFAGTRFLSGIANVFTVGIFGAVKSVFKACTGYSSRFGFPQSENADNGSTPLLPNPFNEVQNKFRQAIDLAAKGGFPEVADGQGSFRPLMRVFFGMRHKIEEILKTIHNAYLEYANVLTLQNTEKTSVAYNMNSFFASSQFTNAKNNIQLRNGEETLIKKVESYLRPSLSRSQDEI